MKSRYYSASSFFLIFIFICAVSIGTASAGHGGHWGGEQGGRLIVLRSPDFGWNLAFHLQIDGRSVANVVRYRHYDGWVPAGRHVLTVYKVPRVGYLEPTSTVVNVQPGGTYIFTAMYDSQLVYLRPAGALLSPGQTWQFRGDIY